MMAAAAGWPPVRVPPTFGNWRRTPSSPAQNARTPVWLYVTGTAAAVKPLNWTGTEPATAFNPTDENPYPLFTELAPPAPPPKTESIKQAPTAGFGPVAGQLRFA